MKLITNNFGALEGRHEFDIKSGINAIIGPNGSGKSTLVGALFFAVTGESLTGCPLDALISWGHDSASVKLVLENRYTIFRNLILGKTQKASFLVEGSDKEITRQAEINDAIMTAFNIIDKASFRQVFFAEQFKAIDILDAGNAKRLEMMAALLGLSRFEKFRATLSTVMSSIFQQSVGKELIDNLSERLTSTQTSIDSLNKELSTISLLSKEDVDKLRSMSLLMPKDEFLNIHTNIENLKKEYEKLVAALSKLPTPVTPEDVTHYNNAVRYNEIEKQLADMSDSVSRASVSCTPSPEKLRELMFNVQGQIAKVNADAHAVEERLNLLINGLCPITQGTPCADLAKMVNEKAIRDKLSELETKRSELLKDLKEIKELLASAEEEEKQVNLVLSKHKELQEALNNLKPFKLSAEDLSNLSEQIKNSQEQTEKRNALLRDIAAVEAQLKTEEKRIQGLTEDTLPTKEEQEEACRRIQDNFENEKKKAQLKASLDAVKKEQEQVLSSIALADAQNKKAEKGKEAVGFLTKVRNVLHKDQLPLLLVSKLRLGLNKRLAVYLELFEFPYTAMWTSDGSLVYQTSLGEALPASSLSGGQKYLLAIANRCALADLLGARFPFMVLDEPTTGLDDINKGKMAQLLQRVSTTLSGRGVSLIVPTHDSELLANANIIKTRE